jgi:hypothetical protein
VGVGDATDRRSTSARARLPLYHRLAAGAELNRRLHRADPRHDAAELSVTLPALLYNTQVAVDIIFISRRNYQLRHEGREP